jgi:hypothetical protein
MRSYGTAKAVPFYQAKNVHSTSGSAARRLFLTACFRQRRRSDDTLPPDSGSKVGVFLRMAVRCAAKIACRLVLSAESWRQWTYGWDAGQVSCSSTGQSSVSKMLAPLFDVSGPKDSVFSGLRVALRRKDFSDKHLCTEILESMS